MELEDKKTKAAEDTVNEAAGANDAASEQADDLPEIIEITREEYKQIKATIEKLRSDYESTVDLAKRVQADFDNFRKRNAALYIQSVEEGARHIIKLLLPVLDNFERALEDPGKEHKDWVEGIRLVYRQLIETLQQEGLSEIPTDGKFDPMLHEAVMQEEIPDAESGSILAVFQKGYKVKEQVLRYSMVKVAK